MGVVELIRRGFQLAAKSRDLLILLFIFGFAWNLINIPLTSQMQKASVLGSIAIVALSLVFIVVSIYLQAGSLGYVRDLVKSGKADLAGFKQSGRQFFLRIFGVSVIVGLYVVILSIVAALVILIGGQTPNPVTVVIAGLIFLIGLVGVLMVFLSPYILVADDKKVFVSLRESIALVKADIGKVLCLGLMLILIGFGIGLLLGVLFGLLGGILPGIVGQVIFGFLSSVVNAYIGIVVSATFMTYYLSLKSSASTAN